MYLGMKNNQGGQVLLIVVLVMVVSLTIGLSVISRSITNVRTSTDEANSAEALAAAEAGIQRSLQSGADVAETTLPDNNSSYNTQIEDALVTNLPLNAGNVVIKDEGIDLWLVPHDASGVPVYSSPWGAGVAQTLNIYWGDESVAAADCTDDAALEILLITGNTSIPSIQYSRLAVDPCSPVPGRDNNEFDPPSDIVGNYAAGGKTFRYKQALTVVNGLIVRIVPIYHNAIVAADGSPTPLPKQGSIVVSSGTAGEVKRKLNVFQGYAYLPIEFSTYGFFSPTDE